jgi:hypothetical protein
LIVIYISYIIIEHTSGSLALKKQNDTLKSSFYDTLDGVCQLIHKQDAVTVKGGMNAEVSEEFLIPFTGKYRLYKILNYNI